MKKMAAANSDPTQKPGDVLAIEYLFTFGSRKKPTMGRIQRQPFESRNWLPEIVSFDRRGTPRICSREPHGPKPAENALMNSWSARLTSRISAPYNARKAIGWR